MCVCVWNTEASLVVIDSWSGQWGRPARSEAPRSCKPPPPRVGRPQSPNATKRLFSADSPGARHCGVPEDPMRSVPRYTTKYRRQILHNRRTTERPNPCRQFITRVTSLCTRNAVQTGRQQGWTDRHGRVRHVKWQGSRGKTGAKGLFLPGRRGDPGWEG